PPPRARVVPRLAALRPPAASLVCPSRQSGSQSVTNRAECPVRAAILAGSVIRDPPDRPANRMNLLTSCRVLSFGTRVALTRAAEVEGRTRMDSGIRKRLDEELSQ